LDGNEPVLSDSQRSSRAVVYRALLNASRTFRAWVEGESTAAHRDSGLNRRDSGAAGRSACGKALWAFL